MMLVGAFARHTARLFGVWETDFSERSFSDWLAFRRALGN